MRIFDLNNSDMFSTTLPAVDAGEITDSVWTLIMLGKSQRRIVYQFKSELFSKDQSQWDLWGPDFLLEALRAP